MPMSKKPEKLYDWNRAFVQMLMSMGLMTGPEMFRGVKLICETFSDCNGFPEMDTKNKADVADMIEELLKAAKRALEPLIII